MRQLCMKFTVTLARDRLKLSAENAEKPEMALRNNKFNE
jgi:hypothetical protein